MKTEKEINVEMVRMEGDLAPFVTVDYMDKDAHEHSGLLLLDTGSTVNILSPEMANHIGSLSKLDEKATISAFGPDVMDADLVKFSFALGGIQFHETFCLSNRKFPCSVVGMKVLGLLGNPFMQLHNLVLDYSNYTLHTSKISPDNLSISDCSFFFPMEIGLKHYGLPVISVSQNEKELVTMVDTGASTNMISSQALAENHFKHERLDGNDFIKNITGNVEADKAKVWFSMLSLTTDDVCKLSRKDLFYILPYNVTTPEESDCDTDGNQLPPIEVVIGSPFMAKERWILDFGAKIMYKLKATKLKPETLFL